MEYNEQVVHISVGTIVKTIIIVLLLALVFVLKDLVLVLLMSVVIASAVEPATQWLMKRGVPRLFSVIFMYLLIAVCLVSVVFFLLIPLLSESSDFIRNSPGYFNANVLSNAIAKNQFFSSSPFADLTNSLNLEVFVSQINDTITNISSNAFGTVTGFFGGLLSFFLMTILSFYLAVEEDGVEKFLRAVTTIKHEKYAVALWKRSQRKIGLWMQGQLVLAVVVGMLVYLLLLLVHVPNALLLAVLAAAFEIIPLFGPILASIPAIMIAFVSGGFSLAALVIGLYLIVHQFENQLIYPLVVKKVVGVSPIVSIVALIAGWQLAGFVGVVLAVPIAAVLIEFFDDLQRNKVEKLEKMMNNRSE